MEGDSIGQNGGEPSLQDFVRIMLAVFKTLNVDEVTIPRETLVGIDGVVAVFKNITDGSITVRTLRADEINDIEKILKDGDDEKDYETKWGIN